MKNETPKLTWNNGEKSVPPKVGWWTASSYRLAGRWRWWDGEKWSVYVTKDTPSNQLEWHRSSPSPLQNDDIDWSPYWPHHYEKQSDPNFNPTTPVCFDDIVDLEFGAVKSLKSEGEDTDHAP